MKSKREKLLSGALYDARKTTVSSKGQIVLPSELRDQDHILPGQQFSIERVESGQYLLRKMDFPERTGTAQWLASCPAKDWFEAIDSDSTDSTNSP